MKLKELKQHCIKLIKTFNQQVILVCDKTIPSGACISSNEFVFVIINEKLYNKVEKQIYPTHRFMLMSLYDHGITNIICNPIIQNSIVF